MKKFVLGLLVGGSISTAIAAPSTPYVLVQELNYIWRYVESGPDNPDIRAFNKASALRDRRLGLGR